MTEINALPVAATMTDDDLFVIYENGAASNKTRQITRVLALAGYAKTGADAAFDDLTSATVAAPTGTIDTLTVATGLVMGATLAKVLTATVSTAIPTLATTISSDVTMTVTGAVVGDVAIVNPQVDLPDGLCLRAYVSASNTVTINVTNASGGSITGASYSLKAVLLRVT
jgi:hypothetical protein